MRRAFINEEEQIRQYGSIRVPGFVRCADGGEHAAGSAGGRGRGAHKICYFKGSQFFDTAQYYETYPYLREALKDIDMSAGSAERPVICTKSLDLSYEEMEYAIEEALRELDTDMIEIFLLHEVRRGSRLGDAKWRVAVPDRL